MAVLIQGSNYNWASLNNSAFGVPVIGIIAIKWDREQVKTNEYGWGVEPIARSRGNVSYSGSITVYKDWWQSVINAAPNKDPLQIAAFDWTIAYGNPVSGQTVITETLKALEFMKDGANWNQGDTKLTLEIPFIFAGIQRS